MNLKTLLRHEQPVASSQPGICFTYEGQDPELLQLVLPLVDYIEVTPDTISQIQNSQSQIHPTTLIELKYASTQAKIIVHGVGLSIGSYNGYSEAYLALLDELVSKLDIAWHSEHLAYTMVDGENLGTMLALPKTRSTLAMVCERIHRIQERYCKPFLLENVVHILPFLQGDYSEAAFLNEMTSHTGCGLILDLYNLECDAHNERFNVTQFLDELDLSPVRELHLACGVEQDGFLLDIHSRPLRDSTLELAQQILQRPQCNVRAVTFELLREAIHILGHEGIASELKRIRRTLAL